DQAEQALNGDEPRRSQDIALRQPCLGAEALRIRPHRFGHLREIMVINDVEAQSDKLACHAKLCEGFFLRFSTNKSCAETHYDLTLDCFAPSATDAVSARTLRHHHRRNAVQQAPA